MDLGARSDVSWRTGFLGAIAIVHAVGASASSPLVVDLPAGSLGQQVMALGRLAGANIAVTDPRLWSQQVPRVRGRMHVREALRMIASRAGAEIHDIGPASWRLVPRVLRRVPQTNVRHQELAPARDVEGSAEIVVTASKRDTASRDFAGQFFTVGGDDLELGGVGGTDRLVDRLTSVASTHLGPGRNKLFIRGIADSSFTGPTQATVGQYFGDLRLGYNAPDPDLRLADLAGVEILQGPQGTLYGAGSLGGVIRLVPNPPDLARFSGSVAVGGSATFGGAPGLDSQIVANLPLVTDRLAIRLVFDAAGEGGYIDKPALGRADVNRTRIEHGRAIVLLDLAPDWSMQLTGIGQLIRGDDSQYADLDGPPLRSSAAVVEGFRADFGQVQAVLEGTLGRARFRSSTGVTAHDLMERYDATAPAAPARLFAQANRTRMQANETRLWSSSPDGAGWLAGVSYVHNHTTLKRLLGAPGALRPTTGVENGIKEITLYGEASRRLLPGLLVTGGLRATRSSLDGKLADAPPVAVAAARAIAARRSEAVLLPSAAALTDLTPEVQLFLRFQQGFRPGGLAIEAASVRRFRGDRVATIEAGLRSGRPNVDAFDGALTLSRTSWRDIQADFIDGAGFPSTANVGDGRLWTLEGVVGWRVADAFRLDASFSYNDSHVYQASVARLLTRPAGVQQSDASSQAEIFARLQQIPNIARATARAGARYRAALTGSSDLKIEGWVRYVGPSRLGVGPVLGQSQGGYFDSGLAARIDFGSLRLSAGVTNLADVRGNRFALGTPFATGRDHVTPLRPRTVRVALQTVF
jgi:outer membrane receptor protein involved in Fe transport